MLLASRDLANSWGYSLIENDCSNDPNLLLKETPKESCLIPLSGDPAIPCHNGMSWIEALASWKKNTILLTKPLASGQIPGTATAYVALCEKIKLPLLGIIQIAGSWEVNHRRLDGLPWCGWIPEEGKSSQVNSMSEKRYSDPELILAHIRQRMTSHRY